MALYEYEDEGGSATGGAATGLIGLDCLVGLIGLVLAFACVLFEDPEGGATARGDGDGDGGLVFPPISGLPELLLAEGLGLGLLAAIANPFEETPF